MGCPPVCGDNPQALNSEWIILGTGEKTWYNYFIPRKCYISVTLAHHEISHA